MTMGRARIDEVKTVVAAMAGLSKADLEGKSRKRRIAGPRQKAMALAYELTGHSYPSLGRNFGGRDHTTCLYAVRKINAQATRDEKLAAELDECRVRIARAVSERVGKFMTTYATSSDWSPPPPAAHLVKPSSVVMSIDLSAWRSLGGKLECAA